MTNQTLDPAAPVAVDPPVPGIRRIGGEMLTWSDAGADTTAGRVPVGAAVARLLSLPARGRVLVAGPHDPALVTALTGRGLDVDLLLRSLPDARDARTRAGGGPEVVRVLCGTLDRARPDGTGYDAILALDGLARLLGPDSRAMAWPDTVAALLALARPGAPVALLVPNGFGLDRLAGSAGPDRVAGAGPESGATDGDYGPPGATGPGAAPAGYDATVAALAALDAPVAIGYAIFPDRHRPALLATAEALATGLPPTVVAAAAAGHAPVLTDPHRLARDAAAHGLAFPLAPAWLIVTGAPGGPGVNGEAAGPAAIRLAEPVDAFWAIPHTFAPVAGGGWERRLAEPADTTERALGYLWRDPSALTGPVPDGELVEERLLAACARHDTTALRAILSRYAAWQRAGAAPGGIDPARALAGPDNLVETPDGLVLFDPSWGCARRVAAPVAFIAAARRFAERLLRGGYPHPWPSDASIDQIAITLASMAGLAPVPEDLAAATAFAADTGTTAGGAERRALAAAFAAPWPAPWPLGHREALAFAARHGAELEAARAQIRWLDETVAERNQQLSLATKNAAALRRSLTYRIGGLVTGPLRFAARVLRKGLRG